MAQIPHTKDERRNKMKKIMFNDAYGLTDAVLQGRKTMMRRIARFDETERPCQKRLSLPSSTNSAAKERGSAIPTSLPILSNL